MQREMTEHRVREIVREELAAPKPQVVGELLVKVAADVALPKERINEFLEMMRLLEEVGRTPPKNKPQIFARFRDFLRAGIRRLVSPVRLKRSGFASPRQKAPDLGESQ